jgi:hypothetical protein
VDRCLGFLQFEVFQHFRRSCCLHQQGMLVRFCQTMHQVLPCFTANCSHCLQSVSVRRMMQPNAKVSQWWLLQGMEFGAIQWEGSVALLPLPDSIIPSTYSPWRWWPHCLPKQKNFNSKLNHKGWHHRRRLQNRKDRKQWFNTYILSIALR